MERPQTVPCAVLAFVTFLLVMVPPLDLAWNDSALDESRGAYCQFHANPVVTLEPVSPAVALTIERLPSFESRDHCPPLGPSIFVPPRG